MRTLTLLCLLSLTLGSALAEDVEPRAKLPSSPTRLRGAAGIAKVPWGYVNLGGSTLKQLVNGKAEWEILYKNPLREVNLYRVDSDDKGRLLASWENDDFLHLFIPKEKKHLTFPKPTTPDPRFTLFTLDEVYFSKEGDAILYMRGMEKNTIWTSFCFRFPLDGRKPILLFSQPGLDLLTDARLGLYAYSSDPRVHCSDIGCHPIAGIVAYEIHGDHALKKTLMKAEDDRWHIAHLVWYSSPDNLAVKLYDNKNRRHLLRWGYGKGEADLRPMPKGPNWDSERSVLARNGDLLEAWNTAHWDMLLERRTPQGQVTSRFFQRDKKYDWDTTIYTLKERKNGDYILHLGRHLYVIPTSGPIRGMDIGFLLKRRNEWGGACIYVPEPEGFWIGMDIGGGRDFAYLGMDEFDKKAKAYREIRYPGKP